MTVELEHDLVPAIRDWLAATLDLDVTPGPSREDACKGARNLLARIAAGSIDPRVYDLGDDLKDVLWAVADVLGEQPTGAQTLDRCDRVYRFISALPLWDDPFDERDEILHRVAKVGWSSVPGGLEGVIKARAMIWENGDENSHRELCATAEKLTARIESLRSHRVLGRRSPLDIAGRLVRLSNVRPDLVASTAAVLSTLLEEQIHCVGALDDREYLKGVTHFAAGIAARQLGRWGAAETAYIRASSGFRRTVNSVELERVEVERLALQSSRLNSEAVLRVAPGQIERTSIRRERLKAKLILAHALINQGRAGEGRVLLERVQSDPGITKEPALNAWMLVMLGNALSYEGRDTEAFESFAQASRLLARFHIPIQLGTLLVAVGEHLGKLGKLEMAASLYDRARGIFREFGQPNQVGYLSILHAELLMHLSRNEEAERELLAVLPLVEQFDLRREGAAALALLREAISQRRTDVKTIRVLRDQLSRG